MIKGEKFFGDDPGVILPAVSRAVYLAGPITGASYGTATGWREFVARNLSVHIVPLSPMREKGHLEGVEAIQESYEDHLFSKARNFTVRDVADVKAADALLVNLLGADERISIGTVLEIGLAYGLGIPTVAVMEKGNPHAHPMLKELVSVNVTDLESGIRYLNWLLGVGV